MSLLKEYEVPVKYYDLRTEACDAYYVGDDKYWENYIDQHKEKHVLAFSRTDKRQDVLYIFKEFGIGKRIPKSTLDELQKFNLLDSKTRQELLKYGTADTNSPDDENDEPNSSKSIDRIVVIDEAIVPCEVVEITPRLLSDIGSALEYRVPEGREKKTALRILKRFTGWLNGYVSDLSNQSGYKPLPVFFRYADKVPEYQGICSEAFWDVINHHRDELTKDSKNITKNLQILRSFIREGTFSIYCPGNRDEGKFRYFYSVISYMPNLKISNPVFILDGTADIDTRYPLSGVTVQSYQGLHRSLANVSAVLHKCRCNATYIKSHPDYLKTLASYCNGLLAQEKSTQAEILVTGFMETLPTLKAGIQQAENFEYYGNLVGKNQFRECMVLMKTGVLRRPRVVTILYCYHLQHVPASRHLRLSDYEISGLCRSGYLQIQQCKV